MRHWIVSVLLLLVPLCGFAQSNLSSSTLKLDEEENNLSVGAEMHTVSIAPTVTFGPSLSYHIDGINDGGVRVLAPYSRTGELSVLSMSAFWRHFFTQKTTTAFSEVGVSENMFTLQGSFSSSSVSAPAMDLGVGILHHLTPEVALGGIAGLTASNADVQSGYALVRQNLSYYPRLALFGNFDF